ncbi:MAG TPA: hypothetical protein VK875_06095 [Euzebyales bacterium]|nr:hypothetical protein [Euzebyales bacterium]
MTMQGQAPTRSRPSQAIERDAPTGCRLLTMIARASLPTIVASHDPRDCVLAAFEEVLDQIGNEAT